MGLSESAAEFFPDAAWRRCVVGSLKKRTIASPPKLSPVTRFGTTSKVARSLRGDGTLNQIAQKAAAKRFELIIAAVRWAWIFMFARVDYVFGCMKANGETQRSRLPEPRHFPTLQNLFEYLPVSEGVHGPPETLVLIGHEASVFDQPIKRLEHQLLAILNAVKDLVPENKITTVDPNLGLMARSQPSHGALRVKFGKMEANRRMNCDETTDHIALFKAIDHIRERSISQSVAVVSEEHVLLLD